MSAISHAPATWPAQPDHTDFSEALIRHNLLRESLFSLFNGFFMGMILFAAPAIAATCFEVDTLTRMAYVTVITCAFPCGAFLGPLWAAWGRRVGMHQLVVQTALLANLPLFALFWVENGALFTAIITLAQLFHSGMRMGQSSTYYCTYPRSLFGRVLGTLIFWNYLGMVLAALLAGVVSSQDVRSYQWLYPLAGLCGLVACVFYGQLRLLRQPMVGRPGSWRTGWQRLRQVMQQDRRFRYFEIAFFLSGSAFFVSWGVSIVLAHERLGWDTASITLWMTVVPQLVLALTSPIWGYVLDRIGIVRTRLLIAIVMTGYLACYLGGLVWLAPALMYVGSVLRGVSEGGGQVTWALASVQFAPAPDDIPTYNGIHFILNGLRGLLMPWLGKWLALASAGMPLGLSVLISALAVVVICWSLRWEPPTPHSSQMPHHG
ncbi:MAG: MFS transporter [Gemmatales bacterium]|nr:MFS transporter [Gemmatales bacterium]MCS7160689.1 MFS transporter [Gemmatales bacterium]MDW8175890.1 MFS transporter [Gemmatales bacterium]MDW8223341.1 MFS transporter [Gemmatales bacterium]